MGAPRSKTGSHTVQGLRRSDLAGEAARAHAALQHRFLVFRSVPGLDLKRPQAARPSPALVAYENCLLLQDDMPSWPSVPFTGHPPSQVGLRLHRVTLAHAEGK